MNLWNPPVPYTRQEWEGDPSEGRNHPGRTRVTVDKLFADTERLREALRDLEEACRDVASWSEECVDYSHPARVKARAALAGAPVERIVGGQYVHTEQWCHGSTPCAVTSEPHGHWRGGRAVSLAEQNRALAERVREACVQADDFNGNTADDLRAAVRALSLDALLGQGEP